MNVLITCAGWRNYFIHFFKAALKGRGTVLAVDARHDAPALREADKGLVVPRMTDPAYIDTLLGICRDYQVRLLVPRLDVELPIIAHHREQFAAAGTIPVVSSLEVLATCHDKVETAAFATRCGLSAPKTYLSMAEAKAAVAAGEVSYPLVVKPRGGTGSMGLEYAEDDEELEVVYRLAQRAAGQSLIETTSTITSEGRIMIQERIAGEEYGLDVINDLHGEYAATLVKRKLKMGRGRTNRAVTVHDPELEQVGEALGRGLGHVGNLDCDVIVTPTGSYVLDLNPRFGGGYVFSHAAGANLPAALLAWAAGEACDPQWLRVKPDILCAIVDHFAIIDQRI